MVNDEKILLIITGLCVSGGPDSMALAALVSKAKDSNLEFATQARVLAFVVDHQAREGSTQEAEIVARRLASLGLQSKLPVPGRMY